MCLSTILDKNPAQKFDKEGEYGVGYKVVETYKHGFYFLFYQVVHNGENIYDNLYLYNKWLVANNNHISTEDKNYYYVSGFHIFTSKYDAIKYTSGNLNERVVKVHYRKVTCIGQQSVGYRMMECVVADEMMVLDEE